MPKTYSPKVVSVTLAHFGSDSTRVFFSDGLRCLVRVEGDDYVGAYFGDPKVIVSKATTENGETVHGPDMQAYQLAALRAVIDTRKIRTIRGKRFQSGEWGQTFVWVTEKPYISSVWGLRESADRADRITKHNALMADFRANQSRVA